VTKVKIDKVEDDAEIAELFGPDHELHENPLGSPKMFNTTPGPSEGGESPKSPEIQEPIGGNQLIIGDDLEEIDQVK
jgi:hypothetical protein